MMKRYLVALSFCLLLPMSGAYAADKPNIIVFLVDDMGLMDTSVPFVVDASGKPVRYPLNEFYRTPHMEALAEAGTRFTRFYAHSVCSPTRSSIMMGQNSARHRTTTWIRPQGNNRGEFGPSEWCWTGLEKTTPTLPRLLKGAGYKTIHVGKAHFGPDEHEGEEPLNLGFDVNVGGFSAGQPGSYYGEQNYARNGKTGQVPHLETYHGSDVFLSEALTLEANRHIEHAVRENKPFFLYMSHYALHAPFESDPRFAGHYAQSGKGPHAQAYATLVEGMDKSLGDLLAKLRALGVAENTLVMFVGDNGSDAPLGPTHGYSSSVPFRGKKGTHYEGGMRVPFIAAWAGKDENNSWQRKLPIPAGSIQTQTGTIFDLLPTLSHLLGLHLPEGMILDGYDLKQQFGGSRNEARKEDFLNHFPHDHRSSYFTSYVDGDWKVIYHYPVPKKGGSKQNSYELFNLKEDPFEKKYLATSHPEQVKVMMSAMIQELQDRNALYPEEGGKRFLPRLPGVKVEAQNPAGQGKIHPCLKAVRASSYQQGNLPAYAVDADPQSRWAASDGSFPQFLELELKKTEMVKGITLRFRNRTVIQYRVEGLGSDRQWSTLVDQSGNDQDVQTVQHRFDAELQKIKITVLNVQKGWATITDLQIEKGK